jgi:hypothetical protein
MRVAGFVNLSVGCFLWLASQPNHLLAQDIVVQDPAGDVTPGDAGEFQFDQDIEFDMEEFEGFEGGDFGAAETTMEEEAAIALVGTAVIVLSLVFALITLVLAGCAAYLLSDALKAVPESHQQISPAIPWLLFIPVVNLVVLFLCFIKVPDSLRGYLDSTGNMTQADCGKSLGLWGSVASVIGCFFPIGIVLLFMSITRINKAKQLAREAQALS